jgi:hypothetical protein
MFPCAHGDRYWPLTSNLGFFRTSPDRVRKGLVPWGRGSPWTRHDHTSLDEALQAHAPFGQVSTRFVVSSAGGSWATVLDADYPCTDFASHYAGRAYYALGCEMVATCWRPATPFSLASANFAHQTVSRLPPRRWLQARRLQDPQHLRHVQTSDQVGRWEFTPAGEQRPFEEPEYYERRRKAERLPRELLAHYATAVGVAVDDPSWWDGRVIALTASKDDGAEVMRAGTVWSTIEELREACGYPLDKIPDDLVRFKSAR